MEKIYMELGNNDYLKLQISYRNESKNFYTGMVDEAGIMLTITKVHLEKQGITVTESCEIQSNGNFKFIVIKNKKKNQKQLQNVGFVVEQNKETILNLWNLNKHEQIVELVCEQFGKRSKKEQ